MEFKRHGELHWRKDGKVLVASPYCDSEGNMFPSSKELAKFHGVGEQAVRYHIPPVFKSKTLNKPVSCIMIDDYDFNTLSLPKIHIELLQRWANGEKVYAKARNKWVINFEHPMVHDKDELEDSGIWFYQETPRSRKYMTRDASDDYTIENLVKTDFGLNVPEDIRRNYRTISY